MTTAPKTRKRHVLRALSVLALTATVAGAASEPVAAATTQSYIGKPATYPMPPSKIPAKLPVLKPSTTTMLQSKPIRDNYQHTTTMSEKFKVNRDASIVAAPGSKKVILKLKKDTTIAGLNAKKTVKQTTVKGKTYIPVTYKNKKGFIEAKAVSYILTVREIDTDEVHSNDPRFTRQRIYSLPKTAPVIPVYDSFSANTGFASEKAIKPLKEGDFIRERGQVTTYTTNYTEELNLAVKYPFVHQKHIKPKRFIFVEVNANQFGYMTEKEYENATWQIAPVTAMTLTNKRIKHIGKPSLDQKGTIETTMKTAAPARYGVTGDALDRLPVLQLEKGESVTLTNRIVTFDKKDYVQVLTLGANFKGLEPLPTKEVVHHRYNDTFKPTHVTYVPLSAVNLSKEKYYGFDK